MNVFPIHVTPLRDRPEDIGVLAAHPAAEALARGLHAAEVDGRRFDRPTSGWAAGITRETLIQIAQDLGYVVDEADVIRSDLYLADEIFMTGTAAELTPLREVDDQPVGTGEPGPVTRAVQSVFEDALHGRSDRYAGWLDIVPQAAPAP